MKATVEEKRTNGHCSFFSVVTLRMSHSAFGKRGGGGGTEWLEILWISALKVCVLTMKLVDTHTMRTRFVP